MKKVLLLLLAALASTQLVACVSSSDGTVTVNWSLTLDGANASCAAAQVDTITIVATRSGGSTVEVDFPCSAMGGEFDLRPGNYSFVAESYRGNTFLQSIPGAPFTIREDVVTPIGTFIFPFVNPRFDATFRVHMGSVAVTGGNCNTTATNGAGVALEEIRVSTGGACIAVEMTGVIDENNVPFSADTCEQIICQPNSVVHTLRGLDPGNYLIQVLGYKGATSGTPRACYYSTAMPFAIAGANVSLGEIFAPFDPEPADEVFCNATKPEGD